MCWHTYSYFDREKIIFLKHDRDKVGSLRMQELRYRFFILFSTSTDRDRDRSLRMQELRYWFIVYIIFLLYIIPKYSYGKLNIQSLGGSLPGLT